MRIYIPQPLGTPQYGIGDLVKIIDSNATAIYVDRRITQIPMLESGKVVNKEVAIHRVLDLRDTGNPIDCEDYEIRPFQKATYQEVKA